MSILRAGPAQVVLAKDGWIALNAVFRLDPHVCPVSPITDLAMAAKPHAIAWAKMQHPAEKGC
jgi:hypothetical protein